MNKFYITTPIYYVNANPHIGHAYTTIASDILARAHKSWGEKVFFLTGTDEHGVKILRSVLDFGEKRLKIKDKKYNSKLKDIKDYTDNISQEFKNTWKLLNIEYDYFVRTTDENHEKFVQEFLTQLYKKGDIYKGIYEGLYCVGCEEYKKAEDLENGECPIHKKPVETIKEEVYFFKLSQYQSKIIQLIESDQVKIRPFERKNEVLGFLQHKLEDTAITRSKVEWGIPVPWDEKQTIYVWVDALLNYLSVVENPKFETQKPKLKEFWSPDLQLIGKDILRFHAVIWLGLLLSAKLKLPKQLYVHGFFTINKQKMSKSLGNVITIQELITKYGLDATRYLLISSFPFGKDGNFSFEELDRRYESELANELGNLVQRTVVLAKKLEVKFNPKNPDYCKKIQIKLKNIDFSGALQIIRNRIIKANQFVNKTKPWEFQDKISKSRDKKQKEIYQKELNSILNTLLQKVEKIAIDLASFMPDTSKIILAQLTTQNPIPLFPKK